MKYALATVCLLTHNSEKFLGKSLESLLNQDYPNLEIIVSDNFSNDKTEKIIRLFQKENHIIFRKNIPNIKPSKIYDGCYDNCNGCIKSNLIKGEFVGFFHSDDIYEKEIVKKEVEFLINNPPAGAVFTLGKIINKKDQVIGRFKLPKELKKKTIYNFEDIFKALLIHGNNFLWTPTFMARKEIFEKVGFFEEDNFSRSRDLDMWLRILKKYPIGILDQELIKWRTGGGGVKYQYLCTERADFFNVMDYYIKPLKFEKKFIRQYEYQKRFDNTLRAMNYLIKGEKTKAKNLLKQPFAFSIFLSICQNINIKKIKGFLLRNLLWLGISLNLNKPLAKMLIKLRYKEK